MIRCLISSLTLLCLIIATCMHVVKVDGLESIIKPFAGGSFGEFGSATNTLMYASAVTLSANGDVYFADKTYCRVRRISNGTIASVVGGSLCGVGGDGGLATNAALLGCGDVAFGSNGDLYIADTESHRIRKVSGGIITTIAGTGIPTYSGDGGLATDAKLNTPSAIEVSSSGEVYIADTYNHRIRKISLNGIISTIAGTGTGGYGGDNETATNAMLNSPKAIVFGPDGDLYIADTDNHRIRKVSNGNITTIAGTGVQGSSGDGGLATSAKLNMPKGVAFLSNGDLLITETDSNKIRKISTSGIISTFAGTGAVGTGGDGGLATNAYLSSPSGAAVAPNGDMYFTDNTGTTIRKVAANGTISTIAGNLGAVPFGNGGLATMASISSPYGLALSANGDAYFTEPSVHRIRKVSNGIITILAGAGFAYFNGDGKLATETNLNNPRGIALGSNGEIYFSDAMNHRIRKISTDGKISTIAGTGTAGITNPTGLATNAQIKIPFDLAVNVNGEIYFCDNGNYAVRKFVIGGNMATVAGVLGTKSDTGDDGLATSATFSGPVGIALSSNGEIYISDTVAHRIRKISTNGKISTIAGTGSSGDGGDGGLAKNAQLNGPQSIVLKSNGEILFSDRLNHKIRKISTDGIISTIAGTGSNGNKGDLGDPLNAQFFQPNGITLDLQSNLYIADAFNNIVRVITTVESVCNGIIATDVGVCNGNGTCEKNEVCSCNSNYQGTYCEVPVCFGLPANSANVCNKNGNCTFVNTCQCKYGWTGSNCSIPTCHGVDPSSPKVCSAVGKCVGPDTCDCFEGFAGSRCEIPVCFGKLANDTKNVCSGSGTCVSNNTCNCLDGFKGTVCEIPVCFGKMANDTKNVCSGLGKCVSNNTCNCLDGWTGLGCEIPICYGKLANDSENVCSGRGICSSNNTCYCLDGWIGTTCEIPVCFGKLANDTNNVCSGHGSCISNNTCNCLDGWTGPICEIPICYGKLANAENVCSGHGSCALNNTCQCYEGFSGSVCEIPFCFGKLANDTKNVCSGSGKCVSNNTCTCLDGWTGLRCEIPICYGKLANDSENVCSGHGICISNNTCNCLDGFAGTTCETPLCFGKMANDTVNVCSGHGQCVSNNTCQCNGGWIGDSCNVATCFKISENEKQVCSGRGKCDGIDTCKCTDGWEGLQCEHFSCFGLLPNTTEVCNFRNGTCVSNNTCSCEKGWIGTKCEIRTCFKIPESDPLVCAGHGSCEKIDSCECKSGWTGLNCSVPVCFGINGSNPQVCSNHGDCISNNTCQCKDSWLGNECQLAFCGGEVSTSKAVCSSHGSCVAPNKCKCDQGWEGFNCSKPFCFNVLSGDNGVCFSHGICTDVDTCVCEPKWKGLQCSLHTCFGLEYNTTNVCHGHGSCVGVDECVCELGWIGKECLEYSCNQVPQNSSSVCSGHGICTSLDICTCQTGYQGKDCELYNCFGNLVQNSTMCVEKRLCSPLVNCSGHGECDYNGNCVCFSNSSNGYWKNSTCNECQENYFGKDCSTSLKGPVRFLDDFSGIIFNLQGNLQADQNIDCTRIIPSVEMYLFGSSKPTCNWMHATSLFSIKFGDGFQLTPNKLIHLNMLVFDSIIGSENLIPTTVLGPLNPVRPTALISQTRSEYGSCEEVLIDGSASYSPDNKPLIFTWDISHVTYKLLQTSNASYVSLPTNAPSGEYSISLKVFSELSGLESQLYQVSFTKKQVSFPVVSIAGGSSRSFVVNQVPVVIGTIITLPDCISNSSNSLSYRWEKISGPELNMISNSKDLIITEFTDKTKQSYTFKLVVTSLEIVGMSTSTMAYLNTTLEPFNTILYVSDLTTDKAVIGADFTSLDLSKETFKWSCEDTNSKAQCDDSINSALDQYSLSKSTIITLPSTRQNISLALQVRDVTSTIDIVFPTSTNIAPLINLLMVNPSDRTILTSKEILNLQLSVSINGVEEDIDSKLDRVWTLNGQAIPATYVSSMKTELSKSNYILLDSSFLQKGSDYTLEFKATNIDCGLSSFYSFKFSVANPIPVCVPKSSLSEVYALETKLTLTLPNCKLDTSLESKFYFTDPKSSAKIYLASGTQITTLLPLSELGFLDLQAVITDKLSGETSESSVTVKTLVPLGNSIPDIRVKQKSWIAQASRLLPGDPQTSVLNSGTISNVVQVMISKLNSKRRSSLSNCQNGTLNSITQECTCREGYAKVDCSISTTEWIERKELMDSLATMFTNSFNSRNKYEKITDTYLLSQLFAMRNILRVFDELSTDSVESMLNVLGELSISSVNNKNLQPPSGFESLLVEVVNSLYRYRKLVLKEKLTSSKMNYLMNITLEMGNVMVRNKFIGGDSLNFISEFIGITSSRLYPRDLSDYLLEQSNITMIKLPNGMMKYLESSYSKRKPLTLRLSKTINSIEPTKDMEILSSLVTFEVLEFPLKNISERIDFRLEAPSSPSGRASSSKTVCAMLMNGIIWDTSVCELSRNVNSSNVVDCLCSQQGTVSLLSILNSDTNIPTSSSGSTNNGNNGNLPSNNTSLELLALLSLIALVFIVCAMITIIICCIVRRKKKNKESTPRAREMVNV